MVFGFALAVIVGFLFTAGRNWSGQPTPTGGALAAIASLWIAARIFGFTPWPYLGAPFDIAFAVASAAALGRALWHAGNKRNYFFVGLLLAIAALNAAFHLALAGRIEVDLSRVLTIALDVVLFICVVMAGRVVPMFTNNAILGAGAKRSLPIEKAALASVLALAVADLAGLNGTIVAAVAALAALAHAVRLALWNPWATRPKPIVWILHASYAWVPIHLALRAASALDWVAPSLAAHALTVGTIGGLTIGMMTRTSLGHTGRPLTVGAAETSAYWLVMVAALARVFVPIAAPGWTLPATIASGFLWSAAFLVFTVAYWPILSRSRVDGQPG
jgi:uncharacterized protein involved in response to NO